MGNFDLMMILAGLVMVIWCPIDYARKRRGHRRRSRRTRGQVVGSERRNTHYGADQVGPDTHHAVVEYEVDGQVFRVVSPSGVSWKQPRSGTRITVAYNPRDPADGAVYQPSTQRVEQVLGYGAPALGVLLLGYQIVVHL